MNRIAAATFSLAFSLAVATLRGQELDQATRQQLDTRLAGPWDERYDDLFDACAAVHGSIAPLAAALAERAAAESDPTASHALWISGFVAWRDGQLRLAQNHIKSVLKQRDDALVRMRYARLLDARGQLEEAEREYQAVLTHPCDEATESKARLRLALLALRSGKSAEATLLAEWASAEGRDVALRNRAANVLALIGRPKEAGELFVAGGSGTQRFRDEVRLATWSIRAGALDRAQEHAWNASQHAELRRDRVYALSVLVESYRAADQLGALIERFANTTDLDDDSRKLWIDLLRETGRIDAAVALFRSSRGDFTVEMQRELVEMYREAGRDEELVQTYRELIEADPTRLTWREGLSRFYLERGDAPAALATWQPFVDDASMHDDLLAASSAAMDLGLDSFAAAAAEICIATERDRHPALLLLFSAYRERGELDKARAVLDRMDRLAPPASPDRSALSEAYEQLGQLDRAVEVIEALRTARGSERVAEDLEIRLAWLYSQIGDDERAMQRWLELRRSVKSVARRRYVEDRLMTVAARLGKLAKLVIELERRLAAGEANKQDSGLLVRLYTKVNDPVSAAEVIDEFFRQTGGKDIEAMQEKARVYLACTDYASYEDTVRALIEADPDGEADYLRSLVMSQLERGRPDEAREVLARLAAHDEGLDRAEFEAGVLALAGLRDEAIVCYRRGIARHAGRIEIYLLLANLLKETGRTDRAVQMFQHLAETAGKDDLFTIAIDGLLNMEAPPPVLQWARRVTLERMAGRHEKPYLYQLLADLSEELGTRDGVFDALEGSLAIAGTRRPSILRELMDLARGTRQTKKDTKRQLAYGRRLISLSEVVPPQVYLDLGEAFLAAEDIANAVRTFDLARDLADFAQFRRQVADLYERTGYLKQSLRTYKQVLLSAPRDVGLLVKVAALEEQTGRDGEAFDLYRRASRLMIDRQPLRTDKSEEKPREGVFLWAGRNLDDAAQHLEKAVTGMLVTAPDESALTIELQRQVAQLSETLDELAKAESERAIESLAQLPRVEKLAGVCRRIAFAIGRPDLVAATDARIVNVVLADPDLLETLCKERLRWGLTASARDLVDASKHPEAVKAPLRFLFGAGGATPARAIPVAQVASLLLPAVASNDSARVRTLIQKADLSTAGEDDMARMPVLLAAARSVGDQQATLGVAQAWIRAMFAAKKRSYEIERTRQRCADALDVASRRTLDEYFIGRVLREEPKTAFEFLRNLPRLQKLYEEPLLTPEQIVETIEKSDIDYPYGLGSLLAMLPPAERAAALRGRWAKVPKTKRLDFLLDIASEIDVPIGDELGNFIIGELPQALADYSDPFRYVAFSFRTMRERKVNFDVLLQVAEVALESKPTEWGPTMFRAIVLAERGREAEAVEVAKAGLKHRLNSESYEWRTSVNDVAERFLPKHLDTFLAAIDADGALSPENLLRRLMLIEQADEPARLLAAAREAARQHPKHREIGLRLVDELNAAGRRLEALSELRRLTAELPDDKPLKQRVAQVLERLDRPTEALAIRLELAESKAEIPSSDKKVAGAKMPPPTVQRLKQFVEADDEQASRMEFRRLWRSLATNVRMIGGTAFILMPNGGYRPLGPNGNWTNWPSNEKSPAEVARDKLTRRGGMDAFAETEIETPDPRKTYTVLGETEFGCVEMQRQLRSLKIDAIDRKRELIDGLLHAALHRDGEPKVFDRLLEQVRAGRANRVQFVQLLDLLEERGGANAASKDLLEELLRSIDPLDGNQVLRIARVLGHSGETERAESMLRWCGLIQDQWRSVENAREIVTAAKEFLEHDRLIALVEDLLHWAKPSDDWSLESYELLAFELWGETVDAAELLTRCRDLCNAVVELNGRLRRRSARTAAAVLARGGDLDAAIRCLEVGICKLPTEGVNVEFAFWLSDYEQPGQLSHDDLRQLFPKDASDWRDASTWLSRAATAIESWITADRVDADNSIRALCLIACRQHALGDQEGAAKLLQRLEARESDTRTRLWIADAHERIGDSDRAFALQRALLVEQRLVPARIATVVTRVASTEGAQAALALDTHELTHDESLLRELARLASEAGRTEDASRWNKLDEESAAARKRLEAIRAAEPAK